MQGVIDFVEGVLQVPSEADREELSKVWVYQSTTLATRYLNLMLKYKVDLALAAEMVLNEDFTIVDVQR